MERNSRHFEESQTACTVCGQTDFILLEEGPHIAKRCRNCGKWSRWVPRTPENLAAYVRNTEPASISPTLKLDPEPIEPAAIGCDHRDELNRLIHHLRGIESHLSIITRALMNQPLRKEMGQ